ncbi:MAG TPA: serine/threonine-protein kinase [Labilithrix sp.]|nr:serine/threonine-protein kinase [Labilithrix sp.]
MTDPAQTIFRIGELISDTYEIRAVLGRGGMGQVFDAQDMGLSRRVAIKANFADIELQFSIRNEARALAAIRHPGVVGVYALGSHIGVDYMVMEHVSGVTLAQHLERLGQGTPLPERLDMLVAIADGLAAIHRAGISHGDVKPENILLAASGRVVLMDLGLVRAAYEPDRGIVAGTPDYMAPEIFSGKQRGTERHLADIYAFGVLLYRMVSGALPFTGKDPIDVLLGHADGAIPNLSDVAQVPRRLSELVTSLLAKDPNDRPVSMDAVVWQLRTTKEELTKKAAEPGLSVLIVDDDTDIARLVALYVKQAAPGAEIAIAADAQQALEHFRKKSPRLVFLDLNMPKMSGFELFTYLRGVHLVDASTVVAMSAGGSPTDVGLMLELGAHDFIPKGPELRGRVTRVVSMLATSKDKGDATVARAAAADPREPASGPRAGVAKEKP